MTRIFRSSALAIAVSTGLALPVQAATTNDSDVAAQLAAMRAEIARLAQRVDVLEGQLATAQTRASTAEAKADAAQAALAQAAATPAPPRVAAAQANVTTKPATDITWDGAPKLATSTGWSFKPRGRVQMDAGGVDAPAGIAASRELGFGSEFRRAFIGFDGTMPGGFAYRTEVDVASGSVEFTDVYLSYKASPKLTLTVGQHKPFWGLDELTSDLFTSMLEKASFTSAFGFERRLGVSATYADKALQVQLGVFSDSIADLGADTNNSYSVDGRVVFAPKLGDGQLHLGLSGHYRRFGDAALTARYRARPFIHTTDLRLVDTGNFSADGERGLGAELAYINGRFHASAESYWQTALRPGLADPTFNGGYAEVGYLLTDDTTAYKGGVYDRIRPRNPVGKGGIGAVQANLRYDWVDLSNAGINGGQQQVMGASLLWMPTDYVRFILNYGHLWLDQAAVAAGATRKYQADTLGMRAQFDF